MRSQQLAPRCLAEKIAKNLKGKMCIGPPRDDPVVMPMDWQPRPILKSREVKPREYEKSQLELLILREDVDRDWEDLDQEIWVKNKINDFFSRFFFYLKILNFMTF